MTAARMRAVVLAPLVCGVTVAALINYQAGGESPDKARLAENLISDMRALGP
jgi:hypothetical protein